MSWWEGIDYKPEKYEINKAIKKEKKLTGDKVYGNWESYEEIQPFIQLKVFIVLYIGFLSWVMYNHLVGNWPDVDVFSLVFFAAIVGVPIYHIDVRPVLVEARLRDVAPGPGDGVLL